MFESDCNNGWITQKRMMITTNPEKVIPGKNAPDKLVPGEKKNTPGLFYKTTRLQ